jgi:hypothetical protein
MQQHNTTAIVKAKQASATHVPAEDMRTNPATGSRGFCHSCMLVSFGTLAACNGMAFYVLAFYVNNSVLAPQAGNKRQHGKKPLAHGHKVSS